MPSITTLVAFAAASLVFVAIPGPNLLYIVGHGVSGGRRHAFAAAVGVEIGTIIHIAAAAAGLSAIVASSATAFSTVKYVGVAYLIYLGIRALRRQASDQATNPAPVKTRGPLAQGVIVNVLNPKAALFFMAFLPQFMDPDGDTMTQVLVLGAVLFVVAIVVDFVYALGAASIAQRVKASGTGHQKGRLLGTTYFVLALVAVITGQRPATT